MVRKILSPLIWVGVLIWFVLSFSSCRDDFFDTSPSLRLSFDTDTLLFDTVFTTVGSTTRFFKIYNRNDSRIKVSRLELAGGENSYFRINADGRSGVQFSDLEIGPNDSLFVFVEVTVDPLGLDLPHVITDSVRFETNGNLQDVKLVAWGQDANFIKPNYTDTASGFSAHVVWENATWSGPKPYVVYGIVIVAPGVTLNIEKGTRVYFHNRSAMQFYPESTFKVRGTIDEPVLFQGDRLEDDYDDLPGQWGFIWLMATSRNHEIDYAVIKNGTYGLIMDSIGSLVKPTLKIRNTIIENMDQSGLELNGAWVDAYNLVIANCGVNAIVMRWGGDYSFRHTTVGNYYSLPGSIRQTPSVFITNYYRDTLGQPIIREFERIYFGNSIIYGSLQDELGLDVMPVSATQPLLIENSLVRTAQNLQNVDYFKNSVFNQPPLFNDISENDFRLMENSPAYGLGNPEIASDILIDILGNSRQERFDAGAFQYYLIEEDETESENP